MVPVTIGAIPASNMLTLATKPVNPIPKKMISTSKGARINLYARAAPIIFESAFNEPTFSCNPTEKRARGISVIARGSKRGSRASSGKNKGRIKARQKARKGGKNMIFLMIGEI